MTSAPLVSEEQLAVLREMFLRDRDSAWQIANYQRSRRDEITSKIRFSIAALNGASAVATLTILSGLPVASLTYADVVTALVLFVAGVALAGVALYVHEGHLTYLVGQSFVRARSLDSCISAVDMTSDDGFKTRQDFMNRAHAAERNMSAAENGYGIFATHLAGGCWFAGAIWLVARAAGLS